MEPKVPQTLYSLLITHIKLNSLTCNCLLTNQLTLNKHSSHSQIHIYIIDHLQFGFEALSSTTMYNWAVNTVIEHYMSKGKVLYGCSMDCSKAFDMVEWVAMFKGLMKRGVKVIFIRLLMNIYRDQYCDVRWNGKFSNRFPISNGVRQGSVSSPILFCCYMDKLIKVLRKSGIGCRIGINIQVCLYMLMIFSFCQLVGQVSKL